MDDTPGMGLKKLYFRLKLIYFQYIEDHNLKTFRLDNYATNIILNFALSEAKQNEDPNIEQQIQREINSKNDILLTPAGQFLESFKLSVDKMIKNGQIGHVMFYDENFIVDLGRVMFHIDSKKNNHDITCFTPLRANARAQRSDPNSITYSQWPPKHILPTHCSENCQIFNANTMQNIMLVAALDKKFAKKFPNQHLLLSGIYREIVGDAHGDNVTIGYNPRVCQNALKDTRELEKEEELTAVLLERMFQAFQRKNAEVDRSIDGEYIISAFKDFSGIEIKVNF